MTEADFLAGYDATVFPRPSVAVDLVLMTVADGALRVLLRRRDRHPYAGKWTLPGGFVGIDEPLDAAARRVLADKAAMQGSFVEQLFTFGAPDRDPRMRIISVAYFALLPREQFPFSHGDDRRLARVVVPWPGEAGGPVEAVGEDGEALPLAFDHAAIVGMAVKRLRGRLDYSDIAFALLPERFALRALQAVHEAILGTPLNKPAFRRRMLDRGWLEPTGEREATSSFRPAELYRRRPSRP